VVFRPESTGWCEPRLSLINSVVVTSANVHDITPAAQLLHCDEEVVYADAGSVTARKDDAAAAVQAAMANVAGLRSISSGGGLIHTSSG
jgi:hypothetical protein